MRAASLCLIVALMAFSTEMLAQSSERYRGTVTNSAFPQDPAALELAIFARTDSTSTAWLAISEPLGGSGIAEVILADTDSLYLVSASTAGDTILWASPTRGERIGGEYWIRGGQFAGQTGTWSLTAIPRTKVATLVLISFFAALCMVLAVSTLSVRASERWWRSMADRGRTLPGQNQFTPTGAIGGWLVWIVLSTSLVLVLQLSRLGELPESLGPTWMLGLAIPGLRPVLLFESVVHVFQVVSLSVALVLLVRRSPIAPLYWVTTLIVLGCYAGLDIYFGMSLSAKWVAAFGTDGVSEIIAATQEAAGQNMRLAASSVIWSAYWIRSRRVISTFDPINRHRAKRLTVEDSSEVSA